MSRQGMIWEDLLTDTDLGNRQYTEIQTGLLFNQAGARSTRTPFKHLSFVPDGVERFSEVWFPVKDMKGIVDANTHGVLNVIKRKGQILVEVWQTKFMAQIQTWAMRNSPKQAVVRKSVGLDAECSPVQI